MRPPSYVSCMQCKADLTKEGAKRNRCGGCHSVFYDGVACQKKDWAIHKTECKARQRQVLAAVHDRCPEVDTMAKLLADADACGTVGGCFFEGGNGLEQNHGLAVSWTLKWAESGNPRARNVLGMLYLQGAGVPQDGKKAAKWLRPGAEEGHAMSQIQLGHALFARAEAENHPPSVVEAATWFRRAAEQGEAEGQCLIGMFVMGGIGITKDQPEGVSWFRKSADQGHAKAQYMLGKCYLDGTGVDEDREEGLRSIRLSAAQGYDDAKRTLRTLNAE
eukprot:TRINITY_DN79_c0_g1_i3.p1 TRINITY_DN79_c0_g1~~TRINITY_DN79_c0_g1_i3.p1  ORF type:complete len:296 (-),score=44.24 TRINITY_DN79_c0_g1_i3:462-1289(-)